MAETQNTEVANGVQHQEPPTTAAQYLMCGACKYAVPFPSDITRRFCYGAPPTPIAMRAVGNNVDFRMIRPMVQINERACAMFEPNTTLQNKPA